MKKPALLITILISIIAVLSIVRIFISNNIATSGIVLSRISEQVEKYKLENSILSEKLYNLSALTNVSEKAYHLGYREEKTALVLIQKQPIALKQ